MSGPTQDCVDDLIVRAHHAAVCVQDFERSRDFYVRVLGFRVEDEMDRRAEPALGEVVALPGSVIRWGMLERQGFRLELFKEAPQNPRGARLREMRMHARRTTKVVGHPTNRGGRRSRRRISRKPFGTGLAGALALSLSSPIAPAIGFVLLRAIIPGTQPVAPAWVLRSFLNVF